MTALARPFVSVAVACVLAFGLPVTTAAQPAAEGGRLTGRVTDGSGAALPGVTVTLRGAGAAAPVTVVTDGVGQYTTPPLAARLYAVTFELTGCRSRERRAGCRARPAPHHLRRSLGARGPVVSIADAIIVAVRSGSATIRIERASDAVTVGDLVALHR